MARPHAAIDVLGVDDLALVASRWDRAVDATDGADEFCAAAVWSFSAAESFDAVAPPEVLTDGASFAGLRRTRTEDGTDVLVGLDPVWGFATPMVGHPLVAAQLLLERIRREPGRPVAVVTGQTIDGIGTAALAHAGGDDVRLLAGPTEHRLRADLRHGVDAWAARRSGRFRQQLRRLVRDAEAAGVTVADGSALPPDEAMDRVLSVEARSWKGRDGTGLASADLAAFYRRMCWRLAASDGLRLLFAQRDGTDLGYALGGVRGGTYRGLQLSYADDAADLGLGHVLQWHQIHALDGTGIHTYDLGMDMDYKRRWSDRVDETMAVIVTR